MLSVCRRMLCDLKYQKFNNRYFSHKNSFHISEEVRNALNNDKPVVALESTIITHGMPYPENVKCALDVEATIKNQGAIPATIAILDGQIKVGLAEDEIIQLGNIEISKPIKTSRRDVPYVVGNKLNGGTTVAGTLLLANQIGIPIFATGGIGGVHREGEHTFDISADLIELGKSKIAVISSGVKSILDIPKTLEYLETQGVFVATFGSDTKEFPAFYCRKSGHCVPYSVKTAEEAARIIHYGHSLNIQSGMLFAVPIPEKFALDENIINEAIEKALREAKRQGVGGKEITPFLLKIIGKITSGKSLESNIALIKNNAKIAATVAVELAKLKTKKKQVTIGHETKDNSTISTRVVVIGGSNLDCSFKLQVPQIKMDGRIHFGRSEVNAGGVGRNICEALSKLGCQPVFISALGNDIHGNMLRNFIPRNCLSRVKIVEGCSTGHCTIVFDSEGECKFLFGDMEIHKHITPEMIIENEDVIKKSSLIVFDANLTVPTISTILELAEHYKIPAFFEPTDVIIAGKPFETKYWKAVKFISPNLNELRYIASSLKLPVKKNYNDKFFEIIDITSGLIKYIDTVIVTLGSEGLVIARRGTAGEPLISSSGSHLNVRHYPVKKIEGIVNVSGAGDSLTSGLIVSMLRGLSEENCVAVGLAAAKIALLSSGPVADECKFGSVRESWGSKASFITLV